MFYLKIITDSFRKEKHEKSKTENLAIKVPCLLANADETDDLGAGI